jgi:hypothetical protein
LSLANPAEPALYVYKTSSPGWVNINDIISPDSITTAMIKNNAVTLAKLSVAGGTANQLIRVNAGENGFEFVSLSSLVTAGSIPVGSLITTGIPGGQFRLAGTYGPGLANWYTAENVIDNIPTGYIPTDLIAPAPGSTSRSKFITSRTGDTFGTWRFLEPNIDILNDTLSGGKLQNGTVAPIKIESAGIPNGYLLSKVGGVPDWVAPSAVAGTIVQYVTDVGSLGTYVDTAGSSTTLNHTLGAMPLMFRVVLRCESNDANYVNGDEIDAQELALDASSDFTTAFMFYVTSTFVKVTKTYGGHVVIRDKTTGAYHAINVPNKWRLRLYAMKAA